MSFLCGSKSHWASAEETHKPQKLPINKAVRKQVEHLRKHSAADLDQHGQDGTKLQQPLPGIQEGQAMQDGSREQGSHSKSGRADNQNGASGLEEDSIHKYSGQRPAEMEAPPVDDEDYRHHRLLNDIRDPYRIPREYMTGTKEFLGPDLPDAPLLVFINSRSGGRAGPRLKEVLCHALGHTQVYDLQDHRPGKVLRRIFDNLAQAEAAGDARASYFRRHLRILAAGGDGTVAWLLGTIADLKLDPPPHVAVLPLGTGNDLSLSFGWGNTFLSQWLENFASVYDLLRRIAEAQPRELDCWRVTISAGGKDFFENLPYSLQPVEQPTHGYQVSGCFWNYMSVGIDAAAAHGFHSLRERRPWAARGRLINQAWYSYYGFATGWMFGAPPIRNTLTIKVRRQAGGEMEEVAIPPEVKAVVVLNLQSYAGGRDVWGLDTDPTKLTRLGFQVPIFNDGLLEVVGLKGGVHTGVVMTGATHIHAVRLAQVPELLISLRSSSEKKPFTHMQLDGEPWKQAISGPLHPENEFTVHVKQAAVSHMLCNDEKLRGMARKVQLLAAREAAVSAALPPQQNSVSVRDNSQLWSPNSLPTNYGATEKATAQHVVQHSSSDDPKTLAAASKDATSRVTV